MVIAASIAVLIAQAAPAQVAPVGKCAALQQQWRGIEVALANNDADGVTDNSAPRATMREAQNTANYAKAQVVLRLMELGRCALPLTAPSPSTFASEAMQCRLAQMKASIADLKAGLPACNSQSWKGLTGQ